MFPSEESKAKLAKYLDGATKRGTVSKAHLDLYILTIRKLEEAEREWEKLLIEVDTIKRLWWRETYRQLSIDPTASWILNPFTGDVFEEPKRKQHPIDLLESLKKALEGAGTVVVVEPSAAPQATDSDAPTKH
jgi:hypothetical protein